MRKRGLRGRQSLKRLKSRYVTIPKGDHLKQVMATYKEEWGFPMCVGAIDGTNVPIKAPLTKPHGLRRSKALSQYYHAGFSGLTVFI